MLNQKSMGYFCGIFVLFLAQITAAVDMLSHYAAVPPVLDGVVSPGEWDYAGRLAGPDCILLTQHDDAKLYLLIDAISDTFLNPLPASDYFAMTFDCDRDLLITPNVDVNYAFLPDSYTLGRQYYLGPGAYTGLSGSTASLARGFGSTPAEADAHTFWEVTFDLAELNTAANKIIRAGIMIGSPQPYFSIRWPSGYNTDFSSLHEILLVTPDEPALACDQVGTGGDRADLRGIRFQIDRSFNQLAVRMIGKVAGEYHFTVELRQSAGFTDSVLAESEVEVSLPAIAGNSPPYTQVLIPFPLIEVLASQPFTLKFTDITGPDFLYFETAGSGYYPCPDVVATQENNVANPTPRSSTTGFAASLAYCNLAGVLQYAGIPMSSITSVSPAFWLRDQITMETLNTTTAYDNTTGAYWIGNVPVTEIMIDVSFHVMGTTKTLPGNYRQQEHVVPGDLTPAERSNHTIPMQIVMHMTDPWDNERIDSHGIGEYPTHRAPLPFAWDAMPQASKYQIQIDIYRDGDHPLGYGRKNTVVDTETADLSYVADLPLSQPLEHYQTYLRAYDSSDNVLGYLMVTSSGGAYGWDYRFKICPLGDLNTDCCVDLLDLALLADNWLAGTGS